MKKYTDSSGIFLLPIIYGNHKVEELTPGGLKIVNTISNSSSEAITWNTYHSSMECTIIWLWSGLSPYMKNDKGMSTKKQKGRNMYRITVRSSFQSHLFIHFFLPDFCWPFTPVSFGGKEGLIFCMSQCLLSYTFAFSSLSFLFSHLSLSLSLQYILICYSESAHH